MHSYFLSERICTDRNGLPLCRVLSMKELQAIELELLRVKVSKSNSYFVQLL